MTDLSRVIAVKPIIKYPREAQVGKTYLMTIDLQPEEGFEWRYEEEEYPIYCKVDSDLFSSKPIGEPIIVLHRYGGSYGEAKFLLAATQQNEGDIKIILINKWGLPVKTIGLSNIRTREFSPEVEMPQASSKGEIGGGELKIPPQPSERPSKEEFIIRFWGVRADVPCPGPETVRYGGNTPCVEMRIKDKCLIFDGGTGLRVLGQALLRTMPVTAHLFFSHTHIDHIEGFPFFVPGFIRGNRFYIYGTISPNGSTIEQRLNDRMLHPNFPIPLQIMGADLTFCDLDIGESVQIDDIFVENALMNHVGEAIGFRVSWNNCSVAYVNNTEHFPDHLDEHALWLSRNADVLIYDARFTDEEYYEDSPTGLSRIGGGHSTWQEGVKLAQAANAKTLILFNHDPSHSDHFLDQVHEQAIQVFPNSVVAWEGLEIDVMVRNRTTA